MNGLALAYSALPLSLIARHGLDRRVVSRGGEREVGLAPCPAGLAPRSPAAGDLGVPVGREPTLAKDEVDLALDIRGRRLGEARRRVCRSPRHAAVGRDALRAGDLLLPEPFDARADW